MKTSEKVEAAYRAGRITETEWKRYNALSEILFGGCMFAVMDETNEHLFHELDTIKNKTHDNNEPVTGSESTVVRPGEQKVFRRY